jgi:5-formyltetrahydrofolate cyclo-ligase
MDLHQQKRAMRHALASLELPSDAEREQMAHRAVAYIQQRPEFVRAGRIAVFVALRDELPTRPLFEAVRRAGRGCLLPRCRPGGLLDFARVDDWGELVRGPFGTREPPADWPPEPMSTSDLIFVPGLAFDRRGGRIGRGGGYYDRTFAAMGADMPFRCGLAYAARIVDRIPTGELDVRVDAVASDVGWWTVLSEATG